MGWLRREKTYDRSRILSDAAKARRRRKPHKAIELYQKVLSREPENPDLHRKIAPLLAETKQQAAAWEAYRKAAEGLVRKGFVEQAIGMFREAAGYLPRHAAVWNTLADLEMERRRPLDAHKALLEGRRHLRSRSQRADAIQLLIRARKIAPRHFDTSFDLAGLLARSGARNRAQRLLEELSEWVGGRQLQRVRRRQFGISPTPAAFWRWLRALFGLR
jgi:tetratricopeptide (TPR) repeat protein